MGRRAVHLLLLSVVLQWGLAFVAIKLVLEHASAVTLTVLRFAITAAAFAVVMALWRSARARIARRDWAVLGVMSVAGVAGYHLSLNYGEEHVSAGVASLIVASMPVMVAVLSARFLREDIGVTRRVGIVTALAGVVVLTLLGTPGVALEIESVTGAAVTVLAPVCWTLYTVLGKRLIGRYGPLAVTATTMIAGTAVLLPFGLPSTVGDLGALTAADWGWIAFLALGPTVFGYIVWNFALSRIEASSTAAWVYAVPLFALGWEWLLLDEQLTAWVLLGGALVLGGVILTERGAPRSSGRAERVAREPEPEAA